MSDKYILEGREAVACDDLFIWARWFESADRTVAKYQAGDVLISTVFLGLNHNYGEGEPLLFETMIFGGAREGYSERYSTWAEAEAGHAKAVDLAKGRS